MEMWAWKVDLSGKTDVLLSLTEEAEDYEKGVYDSWLFPNLYYSEHLFMSWYEILYGKSLVMHSFIQSH